MYVYLSTCDYMYLYVYVYVCWSFAHLEANSSAIGVYECWPFS